MSRVPLTKDGEVAIKEKHSKLKYIERPKTVSYTHHRAHETEENRVCSNMR